MATNLPDTYPGQTARQMNWQVEKHGGENSRFIKKIRSLGVCQFRNYDSDLTKIITGKQKTQNYLQNTMHRKTHTNLPFLSKENTAETVHTNKQMRSAFF